MILAIDAQSGWMSPSTSQAITCETRKYSHSRLTHPPAMSYCGTPPTAHVETLVKMRLRHTDVDTENSHPDLALIQIQWIKSPFSSLEPEGRRTWPHSHREKIRGGFPDESASSTIASDIRWYSEAAVRHYHRGPWHGICRAASYVLPYTPSRMTSSMGADGRGRRTLIWASEI